MTRALAFILLTGCASLPHGTTVPNDDLIGKLYNQWAHDVAPITPTCAERRDRIRVLDVQSMRGLCSRHDFSCYRVEYEGPFYDKTAYYTIVIGPEKPRSRANLLQHEFGHFFAHCTWGDADTWHQRPFWTETNWP